MLIKVTSVLFYHGRTEPTLVKMLLADSYIQLIRPVTISDERPHKNDPAKSVVIFNEKDDFKDDGSNRKMYIVETVDDLASSFAGR